MTATAAILPAQGRTTARATLSTLQRRNGGRYLRRVVAVPDPELGFGPAARVGAGEMIFPAGAAFGPRKQTGYEVILLDQGELTIEIDGASHATTSAASAISVVLQAGHVTLLVPGTYCTFRFSRQGETRVRYVIAYDPALPLPLLEPLALRPTALPASSALSRLLDTILALPAQEASSGSAAPVWLGASAIALFADEARAAGLTRDRPTAPEHPAIAAARDVVRQRLSEHISLRDLAEAAHVAPEYLVRLFRRRLGTTPVRYLWSARVRLGVHLLENTTLPIADIARRVGCRSPKHFARLVRADVGAPPSELRHRTLVEA